MVAGMGSWIDVAFHAEKIAVLLAVALLFWRTGARFVPLVLLAFAIFEAYFAADILLYRLLPDVPAG